MTSVLAIVLSLVVLLNEAQASRANNETGRVRSRETVSDSEDPETGYSPTAGTHVVAGIRQRLQCYKCNSTDPNCDERTYCRSACYQNLTSVLGQPPLIEKGCWERGQCVRYRKNITQNATEEIKCCGKSFCNGIHAGGQFDYEWLDSLTDSIIGQGDSDWAAWSSAWSSTGSEWSNMAAENAEWAAWTAWSAGTSNQWGDSGDPSSWSDWSANDWANWANSWSAWTDNQNSWADWSSWNNWNGQSAASNWNNMQGSSTSNGGSGWQAWTGGNSGGDGQDWSTWGDWSDTPSWTSWSDNDGSLGDRCYVCGGLTYTESTPSTCPEQDFLSTLAGLPYMEPCNGQCYTEIEKAEKGGMKAVMVTRGCREVCENSHEEYRASDEVTSSTTVCCYGHGCNKSHHFTLPATHLLFSLFMSIICTLF